MLYSFLRIFKDLTTRPQNPQIKLIKLPCQSSKRSTNTEEVAFWELCDMKLLASYQ